MTLLISDKQVVSMHYKLTDAEGALLDSSDGQEPLSYLHGAGNIIPGLEKELTGKTVGSTLEVTVSPDEAYGEVQPDRIQQAPIEAFSEIEGLHEGMQLMLETPQGQQVITVKEVQDDKVIIDGNHPLAGKQLHFAVEVTDVRDATAEELEHGHVHGG